MVMVISADFLLFFLIFFSGLVQCFIVGFGLLNGSVFCWVRGNILVFKYFAVWCTFLDISNFVAVGGFCCGGE